MISIPHKLSHALIPTLALSMTMLLPATGALAQPDPETVVQTTVERMGHIVQTTAGKIRESAHQGVRMIRALDENGAPDRALVRAARRANRKINYVAHRGIYAVNVTAQQSLRVLHDIGAEPMFGAVVLDARGRAVDAIAQAAHNGHAAVKTALETALNNDNPGVTTDSGDIEANLSDVN